MAGFSVTAKNVNGLTESELAGAVERSLSLQKTPLRKVLFVVPDFTRYHSNAGKIANLYYHALGEGVQCRFLVALGTHAPMTEKECADMYGDIPYGSFIMHNWRNDVIKTGDVPAGFVADVSEGLLQSAIEVEVNRHLFDGYDLILSIGQVIPHEVAGMANHSKNIFVGCGGASMINASHMLGAFAGLEKVMGKDRSPVRKVFDYALCAFLKNLPITYVLTVTAVSGGATRTCGVYLGEERRWFEEAAAHAQRVNISFVRPLKKVVAYLEAGEFKSAWLGNKAIYRTRMAIADGGQLFVLAPGVEKFGEDAEMDRLIRKYGYAGRGNIIRLAKENEDLQKNLAAAAHLIHGSCDGRFSVTYCTRKLSGAELSGVHLGYMPYDKAAAIYNPASLTDGYNTLAGGEEIYYISNPALGLWADKKRFYASC